jgi:hypothetical protein
MNVDAAPSREVLRKLIHTAHDVRSRLIKSDRHLRLRDIYSLCYYVARDLDGRYPDLRIMVGDREGEHGPVQHMWIEIPSGEIYLDPACDALDPFQPVRAGRTSDPEYSATYRNALDANIDVKDPRNQPEVMFKTRSAWDPEA